MMRNPVTPKNRYPWPDRVHFPCVDGAGSNALCVICTWKEYGQWLFGEGAIDDEAPGRYVEYKGNVPGLFFPEETFRQFFKVT